MEMEMKNSIAIALDSIRVNQGVTQDGMYALSFITTLFSSYQTASFPFLRALSASPSFTDGTNKANRNERDKPVNNVPLIYRSAKFLQTDAFNFFFLSFSPTALVIGEQSSDRSLISWKRRGFNPMNSE